MSQLRSMTGCWTCKVRKKKCGEEKPECSICRSLGLNCGGYRQRPEWMDGGIKEKEMLSVIRETVKDVTSQKKRLAMIHQKRSDTSQRSLHSATVDVRLPLPPTAILPSVHEEPSLQEKPLLIDGPPPGLSPEHAAAYVAKNEHILLMHYLDEVFPSQFRFYQPSLESGGRGWLLSLLLQTKPLYHVACSLAAYHRQLLYCLRAGMEKGCLLGEALYLQYDIAIQELRKYLNVLISSDHDRTLVEDVQLLCSITLLVSIEAFISSSETWQVHLAAAISIFPNIYQRLREVKSQSEGTTTFRLALDFFATVLSWYSIISCTTLGWELFEPCSHRLEIDYIYFDKVMGCETWVMLAIKDIVMLEMWKSNAKARGQLSVRELAVRGDKIERRLNGELDTISALDTKLNGHRNDPSNRPQNSLVTRVHRFAALVYLHVVMSGAFPSLPEIQRGVENGIEAFKAFLDLELVHNLVWPFSIIGCMASDADQSFFRQFSLPDSRNSSKLGISKACVIIEECWRLRELDPGSGEADWRAAMQNLGFKILLI